MVLDLLVMSSITVAFVKRLHAMKIIFAIFHCCALAIIKQGKSSWYFLKDFFSDERMNKI